MDAYKQIEMRFHFSIPEDYRRFSNAGLLANDPAAGLRMSRHLWLSPEQIANCPGPAYKLEALVPCAQTHGRDHFCWYVADSGDPWIAECPRDSDFAEGFAPSFEGFVFRAILEEFADSWLTHDPAEASVLFKEYAQRASRVPRPAWGEILSSFASQTPSWNHWGRLGVLSEAQAQEIMHRELEFPMMGRAFRQSTD